MELKIEIGKFYYPLSICVDFARKPFPQINWGATKLTFPPNKLGGYKIDRPYGTLNFSFT
jgi:hypothetical protein